MIILPAPGIHGLGAVVFSGLTYEEEQPKRLELFWGLSVNSLMGINTSV